MAEYVTTVANVVSRADYEALQRTCEELARQANRNLDIAINTRKETAREIFEEIETVLCHSVYPFVKGNGQIGTKKSRDLHIRFEDFAELKKKYTENL